MGDPVYEAERAARQAKALKERAAEEAFHAALEGITAFMTGRAYLDVSPGNSPGHFGIRLVRDDRSGQ